MALVFFLDLIQNEILSNYNWDMSDDVLLNQLSDGPLKMEEDVSFDYFNLPNTLECINQGPVSSQTTVYENSPQNVPKYAFPQNNPITTSSPRSLTNTSSPNYQFAPTTQSFPSPEVSQTVIQKEGSQQKVLVKTMQQKQNSSPLQQLRPLQNQNKPVSYHFPVGVQGQVAFQGQPTFVIAPQVKQQQQTVLKLATPKSTARGNSVVTVPLPSDKMQQVMTFFSHCHLKLM